MTSPTPVRVLFISPQVTQNPIPFQLLARNPQFEMLVAYCTVDPNEAAGGEERLNQSAFDVPALDGYPWVRLKNRAWHPSLSHPFGLFHPEVWKRVRDYDVIVVYGHRYLTLFLAILRARFLRKKLVLSTDAVALSPKKSLRIRDHLKKIVFPFLYNRVADAVIVPSSKSKQFLETLGVRPEQIFITPYVVDNERIERNAAKADRTQIRSDWNIPLDGTVILFCGKFIDRKRPEDVLEALRRLDDKNSFAVFVGDGPLREKCQKLAHSLGVASRCRFLGFVKYSLLPEVYRASDLLVHSASFEPWGLTVNEAMICSLPVVASKAVGSTEDILIEGDTGFTYPPGDIDALVQIIGKLVSDKELRQRLGQNGAERMRTWSSAENASQLIRVLTSCSHPSP